MPPQRLIADGVHPPPFIRAARSDVCGASVVGDVLLRVGWNATRS